MDGLERLRKFYNTDSGKIAREAFLKDIRSEESQMDSLLRVGGGVLVKGEATEVAEALISILEASADQRTIEKALEVFGRTVDVKNVEIKNCTFINKPEEETQED